MFIFFFLVPSHKQLDRSKPGIYSGVRRGSSSTARAHGSHLPASHRRGRLSRDLASGASPCSVDTIFSAQAGSEEDDSASAYGSKKPSSCEAGDSVSLRRNHHGPVETRIFHSSVSPTRLQQPPFAVETPWLSRTTSTESDGDDEAEEELVKEREVPGFDAQADESIISLSAPHSRRQRRRPRIDAAQTGCALDLLNVASATVSTMVESIDLGSSESRLRLGRSSAQQYPHQYSDECEPPQLATKPSSVHQRD
ncbi:unnamed protein product [Protopolystoma xenopodis]|uniref:Uncharacterized protein n=1 Tax=Protopolystoma xenopodis TaxID=117903 RepID=A0A3S5CQ97_9PLAT|nr:unnamed protein product [Protopolystoma xenopodis]